MQPAELDAAAGNLHVKPMQEFLEAEVADDPFLTNPSPFHRFEWNLIHNPDGTLTKIYYFRAKKPGAKRYVDLMKRFIPGFAGLQEGQDYWIDPDFLQDPRKKNEDTWRKSGSDGLTYGAGEIADLFMVTAPEDMLRQIDEFLGSLLAEAPQIEIETTIVEITLDDALDIGLNATFARGTESDPEDNLFDTVTVNLAKGLVNGTMGTFSAIHDETVINGLIEFLQSTTHAEVLSSPKLAVLNGHRAVIDTGSETPFFTPQFNAVGVSSIKTEFKPTGIKVVVLPFILTSDMVQLDIAVEVSAVTGFVTAGIGSGAEVENPLIARRNAYTVVNVPTGMTVLIGGLVTTDEVESVDKLPFLGDIPLLGYLFKSKSTSYRKAQVLFFVKPLIVFGKNRGAEIYDPAVELE
jgi:type II secretory pathway component GspD/PulD (secretin)